MANTITVPLVAPPDTLRVEVAYYDEEERFAFGKTLGRDILGGASKELVIPTPDFCANYLYYKLRDGVRGYSSHDDLVGKWAHALVELDGQVEFVDGSVRLIQTNGTSRGTSERLGEAIGLSVASRLHRLHEGDWTRVPETNSRKTFDFQRSIASDGRRFILLESKGSSVEDNRLKPSTVTEHKRSIKDKKRDATPEERADSVLYGTIGVLDDRPESTARCWLVDPPAGVAGDPVRFKLLTRLEYIARYISLLGARSQLAAALRTRLSALLAAGDYRALDGIVLRTGSDAEFSTETYDMFGRHNQWFGSKSVVTDGPAGGHVFAVNARVLLFIGIREQLIGLAASQDFREIIEYEFDAGVVEKTVECVVPQARFKREFARFIALPERNRRASAGYLRFPLSGLLYYCQSGLVYGVLPVPESWRTAS